ncbi:MAG: hypothetical protein JW847_04715 [Candidatus Omnitrophica bacterium]|nr:hypothetical protein [Candidatus Omnitrophota bacterium]
MNKTPSRYLTGIIVVILVVGISFPLFCEAASTKKNAAITQDPDLDNALNLEMDNKIKKKERNSKDDGFKETKEVSGLVSWIRDDVVAVEYYHKGGHSEVILIPVSEMTALRRLHSLADLKVGDEIEVEYSETFKEDPDGRKRDFKREAVLVYLLRSIDERGGTMSSGQSNTKVK